MGHHGEAPLAASDNIGLAGRIALIIALGLAAVLFGAAIDVADRILPIQGRPAFETASWEAWARASAYRMICGMLVGTAWLGWDRMHPGPLRRWWGHLLFFVAAALLRGSLGAWLSAPVIHLMVAGLIGGAVGTVTFVIFEFVYQLHHLPPPHSRR
jgi:hypothetical protein